jgi:hypothetical protein
MKSYLFVLSTIAAFVLVGCESDKKAETTATNTNIAPQTEQIAVDTAKEQISTITPEVQAPQVKEEAQAATEVSVAEPVAQEVKAPEVQPAEAQKETVVPVVQEKAPESVVAPAPAVESAPAVEATPAQ